MDKKMYNLEERTTIFGQQVISFLKSIEKSVVSVPIISQLLRSATSIGANYCEADNAESKRDFKHKICIVKKECKETKFFLTMLLVTVPNRKNDIQLLLTEATELTLIFNAIYQKVS